MQNSAVSDNLGSFLRFVQIGGDHIFSHSGGGVPEETIVKSVANKEKTIKSTGELAENLAICLELY